MTTYPGAPRTLPGAIVAIDPRSPLSRLVLFQYNPDEVTRHVTPRSPRGGGSGASDAHRIWGAPTETVSMTLELDAADGLETGDPMAAAAGVAGRLAALEMLLYPSTAAVLANTALLLTGTIEILPPEGPLTVLVLGPHRVVPVRLTDLRIREQAFSTTLMPIRAAAEVTLEVLSYNDLPPTDAGFALFVAHQVITETLAATDAANSVSASVPVGV